MTKVLFTWTQDSELPRGNHCLGLSVTSRSHNDLLSRGNNFLPRGKLIVTWLRLVFTQIVTENEF